MSQSGGPYKIGQRFGPYALAAYLGSGAFKSAYKAACQGGALRVRTGRRTLCVPRPSTRSGGGEGKSQITNLK